MNVYFDKETNIVRWTAPAGAASYTVTMTHGAGTSACWGHRVSTNDARMDLSQSPYWGNIKATGISFEVEAHDSSGVSLGPSSSIDISIKKPSWYSGTAVRLFMLLAVLLGAWAAYSQYKLGKVNDVSQQLSIAETMVLEKLTVISNLTSQLVIATNQPKVTNYVTSTRVVRIEERVPVYDIPQGMPAGPAEKGSLVNVFSPTNQHTVTRFVTSGNGVEFTTPNDWTVNCLVYANEADFDRLVNIGGLTNPHWVYYGPGIQLPSNTKVVAYWIRNRVPNSQLKVEFVLTPVAPVP